MLVTIKPGKINGTLTVPPSKSITQRALAAALLHDGKTIISNYGSSADEKAALDVIKKLGATVTENEEGTLTITSNGVVPVVDEINCGESGLAARLFLPIAALADRNIKVNGKGSLLSRPMSEHIKVLTELGIEVTSTSNTLPVTLKGTLQVKDIVVDGSMSSQFLSGLLLTYGFAAKETVTIKVTDLKSKPYIDLTLQMLEYFGRKVTHKDYKLFTIDPVDFEEVPDVFIHVKSDWSNAVPWLVGSTLSGSVIVDNLKNDSLQADKSIIEVLKKAGADIEAEAYKTEVKESDSLKSFEYDATHTPDLFPLLAILATQCDGKSVIKGTNRLEHKESNRLESINAMLDKLGVNYKTADNELHIVGGKKLSGGAIDSYNDHRIAMAAAIAAIVSEKEVTINNAEAVNKSYPDFFAHLSSLGIDCTIKDQ